VEHEPVSYFAALHLATKGDNEERAARVRHIEDVARDLRAEFRREVMELREEVGELVAEVHKLINLEREMRARNERATAAAIDAVAEASV
jgi:molybdopterin converting factor small subunit